MGHAKSTLFSIGPSNILPEVNTERDLPSGDCATSKLLNSGI